MGNCHCSTSARYTSLDKPLNTFDFAVLKLEINSLDMVNYKISPCFEKNSYSLLIS